MSAAEETQSWPQSQKALTTSTKAYTTLSTTGASEKEWEISWRGSTMSFKVVSDPMRRACGTSAKASTTICMATSARASATWRGSNQGNIQNERFLYRQSSIKFRDYLEMARLN